MKGEHIQRTREASGQVGGLQNLVASAVEIQEVGQSLGGGNLVDHHSQLDLEEVSVAIQTEVVGVAH